jgi:hypothetical protein
MGVARDCVGSILTPDCGKVSKEEESRKDDGVLWLASGAKALSLEGGFFGAPEALPPPKGVSFSGRAGEQQVPHRAFSPVRNDKMNFES